MKPDKINIIDEWIEKHGDPSIERKVKRNLQIVLRIKEILNKKNLSPADLAKRLGKSDSEISKWLTGMHTLSLATISKIEEELDETILEVTEEIKEGFVIATVKEPMIKTKRPKKVN